MFAFTLVESVVSIFISRKDGLRFANLVDNGIPVYMTISVGRQIAIQNQSINKTSVLFVFVSFIILMVVSLAWLVFYYIQRFRYAHSRERFVVSKYFKAIFIAWCYLFIYFQSVIFIKKIFGQFF